MKAAQSESQNRETFSSLAKPHLQRLHEFVRHQLAYFESTGDLVPGELSAQEVVDAVLLRAEEQFLKGIGDREIGSWLIQLATERLHHEIERRKTERETTVHLEENVPLTPPAEEVSTLGEEIFEFYQPDEGLRLENIFPDVDVSPPEDFVAAKEELLQCINAALAGMPAAWRRVLRLRQVKGLTREQLSDALEKDEPEIERILEYARQHLRQKLMEAGCRFIVKQNADSKAQRAKTRGKRRRTKNSDV
jgi:RNA polymerase sigma factor (sigma-70 family)